MPETPKIIQVGSFKYLQGTRRQASFDKMENTRKLTGISNGWNRNEKGVGNGIQNPITDRNCTVPNQKCFQKTF